MKVTELSKLLSDPERIGMTDELMKKLGLASEEATRGRLMALADTERPYFGVYLLAAYVVNDTDFWGDGEIYWWTVPTMVAADGTVTKDPLYGLPCGGPPHKVGSLEWMTNLSLKDPPLIASIPPEERVVACTLRVAFYDDDGKPANLAGALTAALEAFAGISSEPLPGPDQIIAPVRTAIFNSLKAHEDDILVDQDVTIRRGSAVPFSSGMIGSVMTSMIRVFYFVKDEDRTETFGPVMLHRGQSETVKFPSAMRGGGRLALMARGSEVSCSAFGNLTVDTPFVNRVIDTAHETALANGFSVSGTGPAKLIAFYTPP
jgi:hypothetical protein